MKKGEKMSDEQRKKISDGVKIQHREGRVNLVGFTDESRQKAYKITSKGENVGYTGLHQWVRRQKGTPKVCEDCGTTTARKYEWSNIDHKYHRNIDDYRRLCTKCHRTYDRDVLGIKINHVWR